MMAYMWLLFVFVSVVLATQDNLRRREVLQGANVAPLATLPATSNNMHDLLILLNALEANIPFGYAHFNDGEINALTCPEGGETDWGWQKCTQKLKDVLTRAMQHTAPNFFVGITCLCEFNMKPWVYTMNLLNITHNLPYSINNMPNVKGDPCPAHPPKLKFPSKQLKSRLTVATTFINGNYEYARKEIIRILNKASKEQGRGIHVVTGDGHTTEKLPFPLKSVIRTAKHHGFDRDYDAFHVPSFVNQTRFAAGDIVLLLAGPFGRILGTSDETVPPFQP